MKKILQICMLLFATAAMAEGQAISVNGGAIEGTITDGAGAIVPNASVSIIGSDTNIFKTLKTDAGGFYSIGPLNPGPYTVTVNATGFQKLTVKTVVHTGTATSGSFKLTVGAPTETVEVSAGALQINTDQAGVSDVITKDQIDSLPVNGRNFLDLAQIEPGVILQSGESFDPTKAGYSAISTSGVSGRTTRILLDGQDITGLLQSGLPQSPSSSCHRVVDKVASTTLYQALEECPCILIQRARCLQAGAPPGH